MNYVLANGRRAVFAQFDENGDGVLDEAEVCSDLVSAQHGTTLVALFTATTRLHALGFLCRDSCLSPSPGHCRPWRPSPRSASMWTMSTPGTPLACTDGAPHCGRRPQPVPFHRHHQHQSYPSYELVTAVRPDSLGLCVTQGQRQCQRRDETGARRRCVSVVCVDRSLHTAVHAFLFLTWYSRGGLLAIRRNWCSILLASPRFMGSLKTPQSRLAWSHRAPDSGPRHVRTAGSRSLTSSPRPCHSQRQPQVGHALFCRSTRSRLKQCRLLLVR